MDKIVNIQNLDPNTLDYQIYSPSDENLIPNAENEILFNPNLNLVEYLVLDLNKNILLYEPFYVKYSIINDRLNIDPQNNLEEEGFTEGQYITKYNILSNLLGSSFTSRYYIQDISSDRTEIRLNTTQISNNTVIFETNRLSNNIKYSQGAYPDFYLNFGNDKLIIGTNILLDNSNSNDPTVLIKLYEPLPPEFDLKSELWITNKVSNSVAYQFDITLIFDITGDNINIKGPNLNIRVDDQVNNSTEYISYDLLKSNTSTLGTGSLRYQLNSLLAEKGIEINVDYTDYSNFIHFSSAKTRLENFALKLALIEQYSGNSTLIPNPDNFYTSGSQTIWNNKINEIITNFDGYEYYLYYESGSSAWPKTNTVYPYTNALTTDIVSTNWLASQSVVAGGYDSNNKDYLLNTIPEYLTEDPSNYNMQLFVEMLGQHFDNIWIYIKDITSKYNADNRLDYGVSKDLVADILRDFGIKIYQNNFSTNDLFSALLGVTSSGSLFNIPDASTLLPTPEGYEYIDTFVTSSATGSLFPVDDLNKEIYKRIYHNLPYLLKKKGTIEGLRTLITLYGIPDTVLRINEFGGKDKTNINDWDYWYNYFSYKFETFQQAQPLIPWLPLLRNFYNSSQEILPDTIALRFQTYGIPDAAQTNQNIFVKKSNTSNTDFDFGVFLTYPGSGYSSASYSGSIPDEYNTYGNLNFIINGNGGYIISSNIYLPFFDGGWWSVMLKRDTHASASNEDLQTITYSLYAKNKIYTGEDGYELGFQGSSSITINGFNDPSYNTSWNKFSFYALPFVPFGTYLGGYQGGINTNGISDVSPNNLFSGSFQEFRYYGNPLDEIAFDDYVMDPKSIEGNTTKGLGSSHDIVDFRAPLGNMLEQNFYSNNSVETYKSIHPAITGSCITESFWTDTQNLLVNASIWGTSEYADPALFALYGNTDTLIIDLPDSHSNYDVLYYTPGLTHSIAQTEVYYIDTPIVGMKTPNSNKIKDVSSSFYGNVLSNTLSLQQNYVASQSYTKDINYLEVGFSPQNEINDDIAESLGYFDMGQYIGDPQYRFNSNTSYPDLNKLRDEYFCKYKDSYNLNDYIRLIKYFDNSLFKLIKDFVPAKTSLSSGLIIKPHYLERNRYPVPAVDWEKLDLTASIDTAFISGGIAGGFAEFGGEDPFIRNFIPDFTQSWESYNRTPLGLVTQSHTTQDEFYNGEFSGSIIQVYEEQVNPFLKNNVSTNLYTITQYTGKQYQYYNGGGKNKGYYIYDEIILENKFLDPYTEPNQGEIYLYNIAVNGTSQNPQIPPPPSFTAQNYYNKYVKISKFNSLGVDNSLPLGQATQINILMKNGPLTSVNISFPIQQIAEYPTYYLYYINTAHIPFVFGGGGFIVGLPTPLYNLTPLTSAPQLSPSIVNNDNLIITSQLKGQATSLLIYPGNEEWTVLTNDNNVILNTNIINNNDSTHLVSINEDPFFPSISSFLMTFNKTPNIDDVIVTVNMKFDVIFVSVDPNSSGG
jgi:hypothetical protein